MPRWWLTVTMRITELRRRTRREKVKGALCERGMRGLVLFVT